MSKGKGIIVLYPFIFQLKILTCAIKYAIL